MKITIPGNPLATKRVRCGCIQGHGHAYNDPQQTRDMKDVRQVILEQWNKRFDHPEYNTWVDDVPTNINAPFQVLFRFFMPIAKSEPAKTKALKEWGFVSCIDKPDFDNLAKFYADCATGIVWNDDKQITYAIIDKVKYSVNPRVEMHIEKLPEVEINALDSVIFSNFSKDDLKLLCLHAQKLGTLYETYQMYFREDCAIDSQPFVSETSLLIASLASEFASKLTKVGKQLP